MIKVLYILIAILMLGFIVTVHEFGHYLVGRLCGIGIVEFSVGMGPRICGFRRRDIEYSLRAIPLGGYCKFVGEDDANSAPNAMNNQPVWKRLLTVLAGPAMNFVLAFLFCAILLSGYIIAEYQPRISYIYEDMPAAESDFQVGDIITGIEGVAVSYDEAGIETVRSVLQSGDLEGEITFEVDRDGTPVSVVLTPKAVVDEETGKTTYQVGIAYGGRTYRFGEALGASCGYMVEITKSMLESIRDLIFHGEGVDEMMGPVGIISFVSDLVYDEKLYAVVNLIFILSLNIGIMNLLPLPALDGGRIIFLILEAIRRKPVPPEKEGLVHGIGFLLLIALVIFITYKDILRLITGG